MKYQVGDLLRFNRYGKSPFYCVVLESNYDEGVVWWFISGNVGQYKQKVDWLSIYGEFERLA